MFVPTIRSTIARRRRGAVQHAVIAATIAFAASGCAQYQLRQASSDPVDLEYKEVTTHAFFWGLVYDPEVQTADGIDGINDVIVVDNLGYDFLSVITLGIWKPMTIRYRVKAPLHATPRPSAPDAPRGGPGSGTVEFPVEPSSDNP